MSIVVTGASGFVGARLTAYLKSLGEDVVTLSRNGDVEEALAGARCVVHLAARVHVMNENSTNPLTEFRHVNVDASVNLARKAAAAGVTRFVFISSVKVNGEQTSPNQPFTEDDVPCPEDDYGQSKHEAELALRRVALDTGLEVVIIRPPLVYGPGVKANFASLMRAVKRGWPLPLGAIQNVRSLVGLDNLVDFIDCCIKHPAAANQTFLVSDGHDVSSAELVREMASAAGIRPNLWSVSPLLLQFGAALLGKRMAAQRLCGSLQVDISKSRLVLGWQPAVSLPEGLKRAFLKV